MTQHNRLPARAAIGLASLWFGVAAGALWQNVATAKTPRSPEAGRTAEGQLDRSPLQLTISPDGKRVYTANRTANSVSVIEVAAREVIKEISVGAGPAGVAVSAEGNELYVANRLADTVTVVDTSTFEVVREIKVANQPYDLITGEDGRIYVTCVGKDEVVQVVDPATGIVVQTIPVAQNPRHLALSTDCKTLLVTCDVYAVNRELCLIDLPTGKVKQRVILEMVSNVRGVALVRPNVAMVAHLNPKPFVPLTQVQQGWVNTNGVSFIFLEGDELTQTTLLLDEFTRYYANPFEIAVSPEGKFAYVTCGGADMVLVLDIQKALDLIRKTPPQKRPELATRLSTARSFVVAKIPVGANPYGIAITPHGRHVYVANQLGNSVSVIGTETNQVEATIDVGRAGRLTQLRRGEILFNSAAICFQGQFSCASCHPEGHATGLSWDLEDDGLGNLKNIKSFLGVGGTGPFRWQGEALTIGTQECAPTVSGVMRGQPLSETDLKALEAFVTKIPNRPNPHRGPNGEISESAQRGRAIFEGKSACKRCHSGPAFSNFKRRNVGTGDGRYDTTQLSDGTTLHPKQFDVPHLLGAWDSGPYLHDGRAGTLHEIFTLHNPKDKHGKTSNLSKQQLDDLVEYLKSL